MDPARDPKKADRRPGEGRASLVQRLIGLTLLVLFGLWLLGQDPGSDLSGWHPAPSTSATPFAQADHRQIIGLGDDQAMMERLMSKEPIGQRLEHWKQQLSEPGREARVLNQDNKIIWIWSADGKRGVVLEDLPTGTVERVVHDLPQAGEQERLEDYWTPPWSTLEFSSSGVGSHRRHLRIFRSEGGAGTLQEHYRETLKEVGWTRLEHEGGVLVFQRASSHAWVRITPEASHSRVTLLLNL